MNRGLITGPGREDLPVVRFAGKIEGVWRVGNDRVLSHVYTSCGYHEYFDEYAKR